MAGFTDTLENAILNHVFRNTAYTAPTTVYLSLHSADPGETGAGASELSGGGYARVAVTFSAPSGGVITISSDVSFATVTGSSWNITHVALWSASTAGTCLATGPLLAAKTVPVGLNAVFPAGDLSFTLS